MSIQINGTSGISGVDGSATTPALQGQDTNTGISFGTDEVNVVTGGSTRTTVDSSGRLLVGTDTARTVFGTTSARFIQESTGNNDRWTQFATNHNDVGGHVLYFTKSRGTTNGSNTVVASNDFLGSILFQGTDGSKPVNSAQIDAFVDGTPGTNDMPGRLVFSTTADGASSPTERLRITSNGTLQLRNSPGIDFSQIQTNNAGMASETLDSYEEGTWTPTDASGGSQNALTTDGRYTRVGNLLFCTFDIEYPSTADTSTARIGGLPFSASTTNLQGAGSIAWTNFGSTLTFYMGSSSTSFTFLNLSSVARTNAQLSSIRIIGAITVRIA